MICTGQFNSCPNDLPDCGFRVCGECFSGWSWRHVPGFYLGHGCVADKGEGLWGIAGPDAAKVFPEGDIADMQAAVCDASVVSGQCQQGGCIRSLGWQRGEGIDQLIAEEAFWFAPSFDADDLFDAGPEQIQPGWKRGAHGHHYGCNTSVSLVIIDIPGRSGGSMRAVPWPGREASLEGRIIAEARGKLGLEFGLVALDEEKIIAAAVFYGLGQRREGEGGIAGDDRSLQRQLLDQFQCLHHLAAVRQDRQRADDGLQNVAVARLEGASVLGGGGLMEYINSASSR